MNPQNTYFDLASFVNRYMVESIDKYHFLQGKGHGDILTLTNSHCIIYLQNFGEGVGFSFAAISDPETEFSLSEYLDAFVQGGRQKYWPKPPQDIDLEQKLIDDMLAFNLVLTSEVLALPLAGDFSWSSKLTAYNEEYSRLGQELTRLEVIDEHPECDAIWRKNLNGDLTWMDDVRRILAEQESKS
ncbi:MAG: hypothetical protein IPN95_16675 [Bacteroidetes bacterium]|nr:hypothetical protein [Bacteroidota bacterium]